ncbi:MAG: efflux RND transporter periplasmic adaptor subunit [candidate division Zixibacteria bacterium]|nr:efflux RND transporter periplasmic adaptor subunit [candidate division Zixibacteria bacterium]
MKRIGKKWVILVLVVAIGGGALYLWSGNGDNKITYRTEKVDRGDITVSISATGNLYAVTTVQVGSQVSGTIAKLYTDFNSVVKEGDLLAQLDPTFLQATVNEQRANVDRAQAQVNDAQRTLNRAQQLFDKSLVAQSELDAATTALETTQAGLKQARASLDRAEVNLKYATIRTPISGVVISRNIDIGQTVAASFQAPTLFTIANDLRKMQVQASVDEADIGNVKVGQKVTFRVDAYPDEMFEGIVSQIRLSPEINQNVVTYNVVIDVNNPDQKLMPGMTATVSIEVADRDNVLRVPIQAVRFTPPEAKTNLRGGMGEAPSDQGRSGQETAANRDNAGAGGKMSANSNQGRVWILFDGKPKAVRLVRGLQNTRHVEVMDTELKEGDDVIVGMSGGAEASASEAAQNPLMPRMGGMGRR